jgi:transmembrane sensor
MRWEWSVVRASNEADLSAHADDGVMAQAASWLAQYQLETIDEKGFAQWRDADPAHAMAFCRALAAWEHAGILDPAAASFPPIPSAYAAVVMSRRGFMRAAGVVAALGIFGAASLATRAYAWSSAETALGESRRIALPDGSMAAINTDSRLSWRFSESERTLWVERGEVAVTLLDGPNAVIHGEGRSLSLSRGRFNARLRGEALDLLVLDGRAWVGKRNGQGLTYPVTRGESLLVSADAPIVRPASPAQIAGTTAWQNGEILFQNMTLGMAVDEYNRFLERKIVVVDRDLAGIPVGGRFTSTDPTAFLGAVSAGLGIHVSRSQSAYLLTR